MNGISAFMKQIPESSAALFPTHEDTAAGSLKPKREVSPETDHLSFLI